MAHVTVAPPVTSVPDSYGEQSQKQAPRAAETARENPRSRLLARLGHHAPTLLVMALLGGLGAFGHYSGWKLPKFSALAGNGVAERAGLVRRTCGAGVAVRRMSPRSAAPRQGLRLVRRTRRPQLPAVSSRGRATEADAAGPRRRPPARSPGTRFGPAAGEQRELQELPSARAVRLRRGREEGGGGCLVREAAGNRRVDSGQRPDHLRPDPLCQPFVASAGDGVARREERWAMRSDLAKSWPWSMQPRWDGPRRNSSNR